MNCIRLSGCTPEPLAAYLKALAVLRLVAEQCDPLARGFWTSDDVFCLESTLDEAALVRFFVERYRPTPIVAPWNGGSGFYEGDSTVGRDAILTSQDIRFDEYRRVIQGILAWPEMPPTGQPIHVLMQVVDRAAATVTGKNRQVLQRLVDDVRDACLPLESVFSRPPVELTCEQLAAADSALEARYKGNLQKLRQVASKLRNAAKKQYRVAGKEQLIQACRVRLPDSVLEWLDCAVLLNNGGDLAYPPLMGAGGNEGRLDYTNAFMGSVSELLLAPEPASTTALLENALLGRPSGHFQTASIGQHNPGRAGGFNQGHEIETKKIPNNPWNFVLTLEGAVVWASGIARRQGSHGASQLTSPFTVRTSAVGEATPHGKDAEKARAEMWTPLWSNPVSYVELRAFLGEGRAELKRQQRQHARNSVEFAEAVACLGIDRGVREFVRYSLISRRGDSYIALPAGRVPVTERRDSDLVRELTPLLDRVDGLIRKLGKSAPERLEQLHRSVDQAVYAFLLHGGATALQAVLVAIGRLEQWLATRRHDDKDKDLPPLAGLHPRWILAADTGSLELRIAAALAGIGPVGKVGSLRANLAPIDPEQPSRWSSGRSQMVAGSAHGLSGWMAAALSRRLLDAQRNPPGHVPIDSPIRLQPADIAAFLAGRLDDRQAELLLWGLGWIRWSQWSPADPACHALLERWRTPVDAAPRPIPREYALLKLLFLPDPQAAGLAVPVKPEPAIVPLLLAQRTPDAVSLAQRRLYASGVAPWRAALPDGSGSAVRLAAALLVPVQPHRLIARTLATPPQASVNHVVAADQ